ncbi:MAG: homoserine dehydrogenase, partial [Candidatus Limnocylindrales bacterium]
LLGLGTVGGAVARGLLEHGEWLAAATGGRPIYLVAVGVRDPDRPRAVSIPRGIVRSADLAAVAADAGVDVVVELLGGLEPAGELIATALTSGRSVVTANKALLARQGVDLEARARRSGASLRFEAAVGGGIPVLAPLAADLAANRWTTVGGILNGTTNFILTAMTEAGFGYETALAEAQAQGYAEADPSGDVEGRDAADKVALLARLAFGAWPDVEAIRRAPPAVEGDAAPGIGGVTAAAIAAAAELELVIKLVGRATRGAGDEVAAAVLPMVVPAASALGRTGGVDNLVELEGEPIGRIRISGPGAGAEATSSAVLGDLVAIARGLGSTWAGLPSASAAGPLADPLAGERRWFHLLPDGGAALTEPAGLEAVRAELRANGIGGALYPFVEA